MHLIKWLTPGMWLMRKMRFGSKLTLVFCVALLPLLVIVWQILTRNLADLEVTRTEVRGVNWVEKATDLVRLVQGHRGQTNLVLLGNEGAKKTRDQTKAALIEAQAIIANLAIDAKNKTQHDSSTGWWSTLLHMAQSDSLATMPAEWDSLNGRLNTLFRDIEGKNIEQNYAIHSALIDDLGRFVYGLADQSGLLYDPDPQTYLLMDISVSRLIAWRDQIGRLRSAGATLLNNGDMDASSVAKVEVMVADLTRSSADLKYTQNIVSALGFKDASIETAQTAADAFIKLCRETFKYGEPAGNPEAFYAIGTQAINTIGEYHAVVNRTLRTRLIDRETAIERNLAFLALVSVLALLALVYLMLSFNISFLADLKQVLLFMQETANGNMRHKARIAGSDELSDMSRSMDVMVNNISVMVTTVRSNAALVADSGDALVRGSQSLSDRTVQQAANLEQTSASVQELASAVRENALAAQQSDHAAQGVREVAERGAQGMNQAILSVEAIEAGTRRMDEIVGVIDGLAFQTNILALNAAVEAARAGESGRGFAVVASEVRSLAQRSAESAKEIRKLITASSTQVATGVAQIRTAGQNITAIAAGVRGVAENLSHISTSSAEQSENLSEITGSIRQLDEITQHNGAMVEESVSQATALQTQANLLSEAASMFKLLQGSADEARHLVEQALELRQNSDNHESFIRAVTAPQSALFERDMYVFVLDARGHYLAFAGNRAKVGTRVQDVPGIDGDGLVQSIQNQADIGPGWVEYEIVNPSNNQVQVKMSYVVKVDGVYLGCGVYKSMIQVV